jgi:hypothetical protein
MNKSASCLFSVVSIFLFACQSGKIKWNDEIPSKIKSEIKSCNDQVVGAIAAGNSEMLRKFFSDSLIKQTGTVFDTIVTMMKRTVPTAAYSLMDECYIKNSHVGSMDTISKKAEGDRDYKVNFDALTPETVVSLLLHESEDGQLLITCIYGKYNDSWKLNTLRIGRYSFFGNTAIDIYNQSKSKYESGSILDAANLISLVKQPLTPANQFFHYVKENEIKEFAQKITAEADTSFRFPNLISELKSEPAIYNMRPMPMKEGIFPAITYITKLDMHDTIAVKKENDDLQKIIGQLFHGIENNNKYIFFEVFSNKPGTGHMEFVMHGTVNRP